MKVLVAAQEVGGAQAIAPVVRCLASSQGIEVTVYATGKALPLLQYLTARYISTTKVLSEEYLDPAWALDVLRSQSPDVLLLGTAWGPSIDKALIVAAGRTGTPSLSVVDMWSNYAERFTDTQTGQLRLPTRIAVIDELALSQAVAAGIPEPMLCVTGQPHLEWLARQCILPESRLAAAAVRDRWHVLGGSARFVLFVSEAIAKDFGPTTPYYRGYTEFDALEVVVEAVEIVSSRRGERIEVVLRPHPEQSADALELGLRASRHGVILDGASLPMSSVLAADAVVGMTSMLLIESAIAGRPTVSCQPGVSDASAFMGTAAGLMPLASSVDSLARTLSDAFDGTLAAPQDLGRIVETGAARRVAGLVRKLAQIGASQGVR